MKFTLNRDKTISSLTGHSVEFKKGVATHVPPAMWPEVMAIGATPDDELPQEKKADTAEPEDPAVRKAMIFKAFGDLVLKADRESFAATGVPHDKVVSAALDFKVDKKEVGALWKEFQQGPAD